MSLERLGYIELPENVKLGGCDHAAIHRASGKLYVAHTVNDALDVIDCVHDRYSHSIKNLTRVEGALVSDEETLVFTSNTSRRRLRGSCGTFSTTTGPCEPCDCASTMIKAFPKDDLL